MSARAEERTLVKEPCVALAHGMTVLLIIRVLLFIGIAPMPALLHRYASLGAQ